MAVIDKNKKNTVADAEESTEKSKGVEVDIFATKGLVEGTKKKLNKDAADDAFTYSAPVPAGKYSLKFHLGNKPVQFWKSQKEGGDDYYSIDAECEVLNEAGERVGTVFPRFATYISRGKEISTAGAIVVKLGFKVPEEATDKEMALLCAKAIKAEKIIEAELDWNAYSKVDKRPIYSSMLAFPTDDEGTPQHIFPYKTKAGVMEEIQAQLRVKHWYGKKDGATGDKGTAGVAKAPVQQQLVDEEDESPTPQPVKLATGAQTAAAGTGGTGGKVQQIKNTPAPAHDPKEDDAEEDLEDVLEEA